MFSSNQVFQLSGRLNEEEIKRALEFILKIADHTTDIKGKPTGCEYVFQLADGSGDFCIGYDYGSHNENWHRFQFGYDVDVVSKVIKNHLSKLYFPTTWDGADGSTEKGFLATVMSGSYAPEEEGIKDPHYGIVRFAPFTCFYHS